MTLFMVSVPLMVLAVALAVLPLILMSHAEHRDRTAEANFPSRSPFLGILATPRVANDIRNSSDVPRPTSTY